jgi:topoisomerase-4 subunit A
LKELRAEGAGLQALLDSDSALRRQIVKEIEADAKQYGDERRTLIEQAERASVEVKLIEEPVTVIVSEKGWVRSRQGHGHDPAQFSFKSGDAFYGAYQVMTGDMLYAIATNGRVYSVAVSSLPSARGDGVPLTSLVEVEPGARIEHAFAAATSTSILVATAGGNGLVCQAGDWLSRMKAGKSFLTLEAGDVPLRPALFIASVGTHVVCLSDGTDRGFRGRLLSFDLGEVKPLKNGGRGVSLMGLDPKEKLRQAIVCGREGLVLRGIGNRDKPMERTMTIREIATYSGTRGRKGKLLEPKWKDVVMDVPKN